MNHAPLFHCEVCPGLVITPPHQTLFPLLPSDIDNIQAKLIEEVIHTYRQTHTQTDRQTHTHRQTDIHTYMYNVHHPPLQGETDYSLEHLGQVDLPMLTHELQTRIKVRTVM